MFDSIGVLTCGASCSADSEQIPEQPERLEELQPKRAHSVDSGLPRAVHFGEEAVVFEAAGRDRREGYIFNDRCARS